MKEGVNLCMIYVICYKNICKYHNIPPPNTTINFFLNVRAGRNQKQLVPLPLSVNVERSKDLPKVREPADAGSTSTHC
jgi:hypothetical protein